jgi:RNA polymerase sigma-70 factor, ECF subfamily
MPAVAATLPDDRDAELLAAVAEGNCRAFEELYIIYYQRLLRFLQRLAPRHEIAEEVINDTFWIVWQRAKEFRGASRVSTWIMGIAYRRALKVLRSARAHLPSVGSAAGCDLKTMAEAPHHEAERRDWVLQGLRRLPAKQRASIELAYYHGHSCEEIAHIMDCGVPAVKARMFHARQKLRTMLPALAGGAGNRASRTATWVSAALFAMAIGLTYSIAAAWLEQRSIAADAPYRTVTSDKPEAQGAVIHVVFAPTLRISDLEALLSRARLRIVADPTPGGVYSLAPCSSAEGTDGLAMKSALAQLRADPNVRFAESVNEMGHD